MGTIEKYTQDIVFQCRNKILQRLMEKNIFDQPVKSDMRTCDNICKIANGQGDGYTTGCL